MFHILDKQYSVRASQPPKTNSSDKEIFHATWRFLDNLFWGLGAVVTTTALISINTPIVTGVGAVGATYLIGKSLYNLRELIDAKPGKTEAFRFEKALLDKILKVVPRTKKIAQEKLARQARRHCVGYDMGAHKIMQMNGFGFDRSNDGSSRGSGRSGSNFGTIAPSSSHVSIFGIGGPVVGKRSH